MRGHRECSSSLFSKVWIEERIPASLPLRRIRELADQALDRLNATFLRSTPQKAGPRFRWSGCFLEQLDYNLVIR